MTRTSLLTATSLTLLSVFTACDDGSKDEPVPAPSEVRARLSSDLKNVIDQTVAANDGTIANLTPPAFLGQFLPFGSSDVSSTEGGSALLPEDGEESEDFDPDAIIDELNQELFTDENEVAPGIYAVPPTFACGEADPGGADEDYIECANNWSELELRIRVSENDDALRFAVQIGSAHDEPLSVALTHTSVALTVDLDEAESAMQAIATAIGEEAPHANLAGAITGTLSVLGAAHVALDLSADRDIAIAVADQGVDLAGPDAFRFTTEASHALHIELDGNAETGNLALDVGATTVQAPDGDDETFGIDLPGLTADATLTDGELAVTGISLGDRTTRLLQNGQTAIAIDLNKDDGRSLDATLTDDGAGGGIVAVEPAFDLRLAIDHGVLGDAIDVYDVTRVLLTGALHGSEDSDSIEVASGTFSIETNPAQYGFSANAGECVTAEEIYDDATFTSYTQWTVATCQ